MIPEPAWVSLPGGSRASLLAAGLFVCPQYDEAESMHAMRLLTEINKVRSERPNVDNDRH